MLTFFVSRLVAATVLAAGSPSSRMDAMEQGSFDGSGAPVSADASAPQVVPVVKESVETAPSTPADKPKVSLRSTADLFYFTPEEAKEASRRFHPREFHGEKATFDSDVPADIQKQMLEDLSFIAQIKGSGATPLHQQIFGSVDGPTYSQFFDSHVSAVGMNGCGSSNAVACVIPFLDPSKMWLTQNYIKFSHPQVSRMMVVYHEARHTESDQGNWPHATCPTPFKDAQGRDMKSIWTGAMLAGEPACDHTPLGSYGSSSIMLKNIQKFCSNCTDKVRMDAGLYADDQVGRITDQQAKEQILQDFGK